MNWHCTRQPSHKPKSFQWFRYLPILKNYCPYFFVPFYSDSFKRNPPQIWKDMANWMAYIWIIWAWHIMEGECVAIQARVDMRFWSSLKKRCFRKSTLEWSVQSFGNNGDIFFFFLAHLLVFIELPIHAHGTHQEHGKNQADT